jgi:hypothetical protein
MVSKLACYWKSSSVSEMPEQSSWIHWLPGVLTLGQYRPNGLPRDIVAGVVLATMLVPVGIAYAMASSVPGINGLYATIIPLLAYAVFGPSRILVFCRCLGQRPIHTAVQSPMANSSNANRESRAYARAWMLEPRASALGRTLPFAAFPANDLVGWEAVTRPAGGRCSRVTS